METITITVVGCWAHSRRKFDEAQKGLTEKARAGSLALRAKQYRDQLFALESDFTDLSEEERYLKRQKKAVPIVKEFFQWMLANASGKSAYGKAVQYAINQQKYLTRYLLDGRLEISNNRAERSIKPFVIGRKNFLFANTARGAKASAVMYSLIETAKESGISPYNYLVWVLKAVPDMDLSQNPELVDRLLPSMFRAADTVI